MVPPQAEDHDGSWARMQLQLPKVHEANLHSWPNQLCEFPRCRTCQRQGRITPLFEHLENIFTYPLPWANREQAASLVHRVPLKDLPQQPKLVENSYPSTPIVTTYFLPSPLAGTPHPRSKVSPPVKSSGSKHTTNSWTTSVASFCSCSLFGLHV